MKRILLLCGLLIPMYAVHSQGSMVLRGRLVDRQNESITGAAISLLRAFDSSVVKTVLSDSIGGFELEMMRRGPALIRIKFLGYKDLYLKTDLQNTQGELGKIVLEADSKILNEVEISEAALASKIKGDTTEFNAQAFKTNPDASAEDLMGKMPGVVIADGKVQAQGEDVRQVTLDGKRFFGEDANAALRNIPAEVIDKIQIFDQRSDQSLFSGFDDGNTFKAINIVTRQQFKEGKFGRAWVGYGTEDLYKSGFSLNLFSKKRRITLLGNFNNISEQNFSSDDLAGVLSGTGAGGRGPGGGPGGMGPGRGGPSGQRFGPPNNSDNFLVDQKNGIVSTSAFGLNYSEQIGKLDLSGSYFFNFSENNMVAELNRIYTTNANEGLVYSEDRNEVQSNLNHRFNMRAEWKIDSFNSFQFTPRISYQNASNDQNTNASNVLSLSTLNDTKFSTLRENNRYNVSLPLLYRHAFPKAGRTVSIQSNANWNNGDQNYDVRSFLTDLQFMNVDSLIQTQNSIRDGSNFSANLSYTEPLSTKSQLQFSYQWSLAPNNSDQMTFQSIDDFSPAVLDTGLSNVFESRYVTNRGSLDYRYNFRKMNFNIGAAFQEASLMNDQSFPVVWNLDQKFRNFLPGAGMQFRFTNSKNLRFNYRTSVNQPTADQLQEVAQVQNSISVNSGNSKLVQDFRHQLFARYQQSDLLKGNNLFALASISFTQNYIGNSIFIADRDSLILGNILLPTGAQWTRPENLDGFFTLRSFISYGLPVKAIKCNINLNIGGFYTQTPSLLNGLENLNRNWTGNTGMVLSSNISPLIDFNISAGFLINQLSNSNVPDQNTINTIQSYGSKIQWQIWRGFFVQSDFIGQVNGGLSGDADQDVFLWNASVGYKFFKSRTLDLRLTVFDVLDQNVSVSRVVREAWYDDSRTNVLRQYFMLNLSWQLKYFNQARPH